MRLKRTAFTIPLVLLAFAGFAFLANADSSDTKVPGSVDDPVITKSYLDLNIKKLIQDELSKFVISSPAAGNGTSVSGTSGTGQSSTGTSSNGPVVSNPSASSTVGQASTNMAVVKLEAGQTLYAGAGTEFIVRTGKALAISSDENGIPDVTAGKDIGAGSAIELNHLLIFPTEGRGIKPDPKQKIDIYVMIKGAYLQVNADGSKKTP